MDPISEGAMVIMGRPVKAFMDQNHGAHLAVHQFQAGQMPQPQQGVMNAHLQEHMAMAHYMQFMQSGVQMPPMNWSPETGQPMYPSLPPQIETQIAIQAAQEVQKIVQQQAQEQAKQAPPLQAPPPVDPQVGFQADQQRRDAAFQAEQQRKNAGLAADVDRKDALEGLSPQMVKQAEEFVQSNNLQMSARELAVLSKALGKPFTDVVASLSKMMMQGQGGSQFSQTEDFNSTAPNFR